MVFFPCKNNSKKSELDIFLILSVDTQGLHKQYLDSLIFIFNADSVS